MNAETLVPPLRTAVVHRGEYEVLMLPDITDEPAATLASLTVGRQCLVVTTPSVSMLHARSLFRQVFPEYDDSHYLVLKSGEEAKTIEQVLCICSRAAEIKLERTGLIIAVGGGVCSDLVTMAASTIRRGVGYIKIPTTLMGQVDAGIGIKGAINFNEKKNYLGCFYPPTAVLIAPRYLSTLPRRHVVAGLAEIIKMAIVCDSQLFLMIEEYGETLIERRFATDMDMSAAVLRRSIRSMMDELSLNIYEDRLLPRKVDFGHSISPTLEIVSNFALSHGEAVSIDMAWSAVLAMKLGFLSTSACERIITLLKISGLPIWTSHLNIGLCLHALEESVRHRRGCLHLPIPTDIGCVRFIESLQDIPNEVLVDCLDNLEAESR